MPKPITNSYWAQRVRALAGQGERPSDIASDVQSEAKRLGRDDYPRLRTVYRLCEDYRQQPEEERLQERPFHWPESFESPASRLSWDAAGFALDCLRFCDMKGLGRPSVREVKWYSRLKFAANTIDAGDAYTWGRLLAAEEMANLFIDPPVHEDQSGKFEPMEWVLAYRPWESLDAKRAYEKARHRQTAPIPNLGIRTFGPGAAARKFGSEEGSGVDVVYGRKSLRDQYEDSIEKIRQEFPDGPDDWQPPSEFDIELQSEGKNDGEAGQ